jgi:putative transposase
VSRRSVPSGDALPALVTIRLLTRLLVLPNANNGTKDLEILVLRHQLRVLRRKTGRPGSPRSTGSCSPPQAACFPQTAGHRSSSRRRRCCAGIARSCDPGGPTGRATGRADRRSTRRSLASSCGWPERNSRWGCVRIAGELRKLGIRVGATTIRTLLRRHGLGPAPTRSGPTWMEFLRAQAQGIVACDLLHGGDDPAQDAVCAVLHPPQ